VQVRGVVAQFVAPRRLPPSDPPSPCAAASSVR
jgi:hypothetical protein